MRFAKELLLRLSISCRDLSKEDLATVTNILKLKVKSMHSQLYVDAISQILKSNPEYPAIAFRFFVMNEIATAKAQMQYQPVLRFALITFKSIPSTWLWFSTKRFQEIASSFWEKSFCKCAFQTLTLFSPLEFSNFSQLKRELSL